MGATDEHWCSRCKRSVDKVKEEYLELTAINDPAVLGLVTVEPMQGNKKATKKDEVKRFSKGVMCESCARKVKIVEETDGKEKKTSLWVYFKELRREGNPDFHVVIKCNPVKDGFIIHPSECETYEQAPFCPEGSSADLVNCEHIAVDLKGRVYCKRMHPGGLSLTMEKAVVDRQKAELVMEQLFTMLKTNPALMRLQQKSTKESLRALLETLGYDPDIAHEADPLVTGADMGGVKAAPVEPFLGSTLASVPEPPKVKVDAGPFLGGVQEVPADSVTENAEYHIEYSQKSFLDIRRLAEQGDPDALEEFGRRVLNFGKGYYGGRTETYFRKLPEGMKVIDMMAASVTNEPRCFDCRTILDDDLTCPDCGTKYTIPYEDGDSRFMSKVEKNEEKKDV